MFISARRYHTTVFSMYTSPCLIVFGGIINYNKFTSELLLFDLEKKQWNKPHCTGKSPPPISSHTSNLLGINMFVIGGLTKGKKFNTEIYTLDVETFIWTRLDYSEIKISPRAFHTAINYGKCIIIIGGVRPKTELEEKEDNELKKEEFKKEQIKKEQLKENDSSYMTSTISEIEFNEVDQYNSVKLDLNELLIICLGIFL